uniref:Sodium-coupled neutral amino acid transporter 7 n=1 Tax=Corvus moneduloides TaxID=1196302 RepID=A0A8C3H141_CORMO
CGDSAQKFREPRKWSGDNVGSGSCLHCGQRCPRGWAAQLPCCLQHGRWRGCRHRPADGERVGKGQFPVPSWEDAWKGRVVPQKGFGEDQAPGKKLFWVRCTRDAQCFWGGCLGWFGRPCYIVGSVFPPCLSPIPVHVDLHHRRLGDPGVLLAGQQRAHLPGGCVGCLREGAWCAVRGGHRCLHLWHLHRLPHHHWRSRGQDHCCSGEGARGSWEQLLVHRPQVHHQHHRLPPHPAPLHPQRDWLPKICQFPHLGGRGAAEHRAATVPYFRACVPPFCMLEEAGGAAFNCIVSYLWSWQSSRKESHSLSVIGTWYVTAVIIIKYIWPDKELVPVEIPTSPSTWTAVFNAMPTICFGFQCHVSSVPVFNSMKQPEVKTWGAVVTAAMVIALFVYTGTGACGFLTFGAGVEQDVLMSYPSNDIPVALARAFIILCVLTSYPILHFCGRALPDSSQALRDPRNQGNQLVGPGQLWGLHGHPWSLHLWTDHCQCHLCGSYSLTPPGWTALMLLKGWRFPLGPKGSGKKTCWCVGKIQENCCDLGLS